jgi:hypothetical protein
MMNQSYKVVAAKNIQRAYNLGIPFSVMAADTDSSRSPELPMQVVHPYPTRWNPCLLKYS